jgi:CHAT domain-containing protein/tetratricopeptide (TPR) repeat protein
MVLPLTRSPDGREHRRTMLRIPHPAARRTLLLAAVAALHVAVPGRVSAAGRPWTRHASLISRADRLFVTGRLDACGALLDSAIAAAANGRDRGLERIARIRRARLETLARQVVEARQDAQLALVDARAVADTLSECRALQALGGLDALNPEPSTESARRALTLARHARLADEQSAAWIVIGSADLQAQRIAAATADHRRALRLLAGSSDWRGIMTAHAGLERCLIALQDYAGARREHVIVLREAVRHDDLVQQSETWINRGVIEHSAGNPAEAETYYRRAAVMSRRIGLTRRAVFAERTLALLYVNLGRAAQSESLLTHLLPDVENGSDMDLRGSVYSQLGVAYRQLGRYADAEAYGRRAVALSDSVAITYALQFTMTLSSTLSRENKLADALELVEAQRTRLDRRMLPKERNILDPERARLLVALGRPRDAIATLRTIVHASPPVAGLQGYDAIIWSDQLARCHRALGERDSALARYRETTERWEMVRRGVRDKTWREALDNVANEFSGRYATLLLDSARGGTAEARARDAFDMLQRFRGRTLSERVRGPGPGSDAGFEPIDLATLQTRGLERGEVFLDVHASPETTIVFAVTNDRILAWTAASASRLWPRMRRLQDLLTDASNAHRPVLADAARSLGSDVFGPASAMLVSSPRVLLSAGSLARYPLGALVAVGEQEPLSVAHEVAIVPSATLLTATRSRPIDGVTSASRVLAIAATLDSAGHALPAAAREVRRLAQDYEGAEAHVDEPWTAEQFAARDLHAFAVLHFATHTRVNAQEPWHSGIQVGDARVRGGCLEAARIARLRVAARLCVLSSCTSMSGRGDTGETLYGVAAAWLAAGVPTVIATQWESDDRALAEFTSHLYAHLARGERAGTALRAAAAEVRANPRFAAPYFWQGIVLLGDPDTRVPLRPRRGLSRLLPGS